MLCYIMKSTWTRNEHKKITHKPPNTRRHKYYSSQVVLFESSLQSVDTNRQLAHALFLQLTRVIMTCTPKSRWCWWYVRMFHNNWDNQILTRQVHCFHASSYHYDHCYHCNTESEKKQEKRYTERKRCPFFRTSIHTYVIKAGEEEWCLLYLKFLMEHIFLSNYS